MAPEIMVALGLGPVIRYARHKSPQGAVSGPPEMAPRFPTEHSESTHFPEPSMRTGVFANRRIDLPRFFL